MSDRSGKPVLDLALAADLDTLGADGYDADGIKVDFTARTSFGSTTIARTFGSWSTWSTAHVSRGPRCPSISSRPTTGRSPDRATWRAYVEPA